MTSTTKRRPGRPARLRRDEILRAAVDLADADGLEALTMRMVAHRLGAEAMSLYRHVANKQDLLDGMIDLVFAEIETPERDAPWKPAMRSRATSARQVLARHPWAIGLMESRVRPGPANMRHHDAVLAVLLGAGSTSAMATRIYNLVDSYVYGFALQERALPVTTPEQLADVGDAILASMPVDEFPHLARVGRDLMESGFDYRAEFEPGLDLILDAVGSRIATGT